MTEPNVAMTSFD